MNTHFDLNDVLEVRAILRQIYKNIRMLIRNNPTVRATLNLDTKDEGTYITDVAFGLIDKMVEYCEVNGYTTRRIYLIVQEINRVEMVIKDILQYFHYFIRPDFRQKPDIELATESYKEIADKTTVGELREIVGKNHQVDFEGLGSSRIDLNRKVDYDETVDGELEEETDDENAEVPYN